MASPMMPRLMLAILISFFPRDKRDPERASYLARYLRLAASRSPGYGLLSSCISLISSAAQSIAPSE